MTISRLAGIPDCYAAISDIIRDHGTDLPEASYGALAAFVPSPVVRIVNCAEALYGAVKSLEAGTALDAACTVCAQLAMTCVDNQWHDIGQSARGGQIELACRRIAGEPDIAQDEADDPAPLEEFAA